MAYNLTKFEQNNLSVGTQSYTSDFSPEVKLGIDSKNVTTGIVQGIGPRFGMAPIPGQQDTEGAAGECNSIRQSEGTGSAYENRLAYFGCYRVLTASTNTFLWITGSGTADIDITISSSLVSTKYQPVSAITGGLHKPAQDSSTMDSRSPALWLIPENMGGASKTWLTNILTAQKSYISTAHVSVSGQNIQQEYLAGKYAGAAAVGGACPKINFNASYSIDGVGTTAYPTGGAWVVNSGNVSKEKHTFTIYEIVTVAATSGIKNTYVYKDTALSDFTPVAAPYQDTTTVQMIPTAATTVIAGPGTGTASAILIQDKTNFINSAYEAILLAAGKPIACILQDSIRNQDGTFEQYVDLTKIGQWPNSVGVDANKVPTCWRAFGPTSVSGSSLMGLLRKDVTYQFTYSLFNKRLNFETNVGAPISYTNATDDYYYIVLFLNETVSVDGVGKKSFQINDYEIRSYYREVGSFEWLPSTKADLALLPLGGAFSIGNSAVSSAVGGQPGGFNDYSMIPVDTYDCVTGWQGRAFWSSKKNLVFSMRDNIFAYPLRNSVAAPTGEFRGTTVHAFPGQAEQRGRLIIWGSEESYVASFTGNQTLQTVQISPDTSGEFPVDGSDFKVERWTTTTAFSHRAAIVAEGDLYYWGAKGLFLDNGTDFPTRASIGIEPDIFNLYDATKTNEIFAHYFALTKEIYWFYVPRGLPLVTHALILNTQTGGIYRAEFNCKIDSAQDISIENTADTQANLIGKRTILSVRASSAATLQRPYFFDIRNRSGDQSPGVEIMVKSFTSTSTAAVLTLASGYNATSLGSLIVGDYVAIHQAAYYTGAAVVDFVGQITNITLPAITISKPATATMPATWTASARGQYFPVWAAPLTQIPYRIKTQYWSPLGLSAWFRFLFTHMQFKVNLWPTKGNYNISLGYRTPIAAALATKTITLADNSDGNCQIYSPLPGTDQAFEGQGIRFDVSGVHNGGEWVLQYLAVHAEPQDGDNVMTFEG
jgi:hypothetical protein